eukprot:592589-Prymnesium_polylepis.1
MGVSALRAADKGVSRCAADTVGGSPFLRNGAKILRPASSSRRLEVQCRITRRAALLLWRLPRHPNF